MRRRCSLRAVLALGARRAGARERGASDAERDGGRAQLPDLQDVARHVRRPAAQDIKDYIRQRIAEGATKTEITDELVAQLGPGVRARADDARLRPARVAAAVPRDRARRGRARGGRVVLVARPSARRRRRPSWRRRALRSSRSSSGASTRSSRASMLEKLPVAFLAGFVSVVTPCVLPLVPGLPLGGLVRRRRPARRARSGEAGGHREHPVHHRLHPRVRRSRRGARLRSRASCRSRARPRSPASR